MSTDFFANTVNQISFAHQSKSAVSTHGVSKDTNSLTVHLVEIIEDRLWKLGCYVAVHVITFAPRSLRRIYVEASARAKIVRIIFSFNFQATYRTQHRHSVSDLTDQSTGEGDHACMVKAVALMITKTRTLWASLRGLVSGYKTAIPFSLALCWKNPFSAPLSPVQVKPAR